MRPSSEARAGAGDAAFSSAGSTSRIDGTTERISSMRCMAAAPRWISATTQPMMKVGKVSWKMYMAKVKNSPTESAPAAIR